MFNNRTLSVDCWPAFKLATSLLKILVYHVRCNADIPMKSFVSFLGGNSLSTSTLTRRNMNGRRTVCRRLITFSVAAKSSVLNHESKEVEQSKTSGNKKLSKAHNSWRLFCKGVPVINNLKSVGSKRTNLAREEFSFLIRCACCNNQQSSIHINKQNKHICQRIFSRERERDSPRQ